MQESDPKDENTDNFDDDPAVKDLWRLIETDPRFSLEYFREKFKNVHKK